MIVAVTGRPEVWLHITKKYDGLAPGWYAITTKASEHPKRLSNGWSGPFESYEAAFQYAKVAQISE
jgi:hypothetical protein